MAITDAPAPQGAPGGPRKEPWSGLRKLLPFTTIGVIIAALYVAWTFYSRHQSDVEATRAAAAKEQEIRQKEVTAAFGSGEILFNNFSADKGLLKRGEHTQLCYGVENATRVSLEPAPSEELKPAYRHCLEISPKTTTTYKITAFNAKGASKSESLTVRVE
jgi:hypothetical protein